MKKPHKIITLLYHRIATQNCDPWKLCVSSKHFEQQVKYLKNNYNVISTDELVQQVQHKEIKESSVCITFDDGYADNFITARPLLELYNCPATFFITTFFTNKKRLFWWDELAALLLQSAKILAPFSLNINGKTFTYFPEENELTDSQFEQQKKWLYYQTPPTRQCKIYLDIWEKLRPLPYLEIAGQIDFLKKYLQQIENKDISSLPMNAQQLQLLSNHTLFTLALHTHTHPAMATLKKQAQFKEIINPQIELKEKYNVDSLILAYPYGNFSTDTIEVAQEAGLIACFTTEEKVIQPGENLFRLGRFQVPDIEEHGFKNFIEGII